MDSVPIRLSIQAARRLHLAAQGLAQRPALPAAKPDVLEAIRRMGLLQIDTISVVARSPYLVLWSRLGDYDPVWLDALLAEGSLFEYWSHAACFLPIEEYPIYRRLMLDYAPRSARPEDAEVEQRVLQLVREQGAVRSAHFTSAEPRRGAWWDWKPEKIALERLFNSGVLMIARREGFQRVYALQERVLPGWDDARAHDYAVGTRWMVERAVRALGIARPRWITPYFPDYLRNREARSIAAKLLPALMAEGTLVQVEVEGWDDPLLLHRDNAVLAQMAADNALPSDTTALLSPFDPVVSHRERAEELFGFSYRIETYTPSEKRRYGYFSLPILHCGELVGRLDAKAHRKEGRFEVRSLHLEAGIEPEEALLAAVGRMLQQCAAWHGTREVIIGACDPPHAADALRLFV